MTNCYAEKHLEKSVYECYRMPKNADYTKCQIYKFVCKDLTVKDCYVGSTCSWIKRKALHKQSVNCEKNAEYNYKKATIIRENGGWNNWEMVLIENYPCKTDLEARAKEREWFEKLGATMNSQTPLRTPEELIAYNIKYREEHREEQTAYAAKYHEENRESRNAKCLAKNLKKMTCACGKEHTKGFKSGHLKSKKHIEWEKQNETKSVPNTNEPEV